MPPPPPEVPAEPRVLLLSNARDAEGRFLHHAMEPLGRLLHGVRTVTFLPYAAVTTDWDRYTARVTEAMAPLGIAVRPVHRAPNPVAEVGQAEAILVGGGNTFQLLRAVQAAGLLIPLRARVRAGIPYAGWSAGAVLAGPTIGTTNDMPIVLPGSLEALGFVPFHLNAHFTDAHPPGFRGETRRERLAEFLTVHRGATVVGLPEGSWIEVVGESMRVGGAHDALRFRHGEPITLLPPGSRLEEAMACR